MSIDAAHILLVAALMIAGVCLVMMAWYRKRSIESTASDKYLSVPIKVFDVHLVPNYLYGEALAGPLNERTSIVLVRYRYSYNGQTYEGRDVFPTEIEWIKPRVSPFSLFEDLKSGRITHCFVDASKPSRAVILRGWSPYLKKHIMGVFAAGVLVFIAGMLLV